METTTQIAVVTVQVPYFRTYDQFSVEDVSFRVYRNEDSFKAVPQTPFKDYKLSGLPLELMFVYTNYVVLSANNMDDEALDVIKKIILELQGQDLL